MVTLFCRGRERLVKYIPCRSVLIPICGPDPFSRDFEWRSNRYNPYNRIRDRQGHFMAVFWINHPKDLFGADK